jgi:hypothetical protein
MKLNRRILSFAALGAFACTAASATTIVDGVQSATGGTITSFSTAGAGTATTTISAYNSANAAASISCPVGDTCSGPTLYEIDLGVSVSDNGSLTLTNQSTSNGTVYIRCLETALGAAPGCPTGSGATGNGIALVGELGYAIYDAFTGSTATSAAVLSGTDTSVFYAPVTTTAVVQGVKYSVLPVTSAGSTFSGTNTASIPMGEAYASTDSAWASESAAYATNPVTLNISLAGDISSGTSDNNIGQSNNVDNLAGQVTAQYLFSYTETSTSATPEPTTMVLMGGALLGVGLIRRRQVKRG